MDYRMTASCSRRCKPTLSSVVKCSGNQHSRKYQRRAIFNNRQVKTITPRSKMALSAFWCVSEVLTGIPSSGLLQIVKLKRIKHTIIPSIFLYTSRSRATSIRQCLCMKLLFIFGKILRGLFLPLRTGKINFSISFSTLLSV